MAEFNFALEEKDLKDMSFCTGYTARKIDDTVFVDAAGTAAGLNLPG